MALGDGARRLDALEREVAALRAELAQARQTGELEAERARAATAMGTLGERLATLTDLADRAASAGSAAAALADRVETLERRAGDAERQAPDLGAMRRVAADQAEQLALLKSSLASLERRLTLQSEEFAQAVTGLVAEVAAVRRGDPVA